MSSSTPPTNNDDDDITYNCKFFQIHHNGTVKVHRPMRDRPVPPPSQTQFKDVVVSESDNITARIFLPKIQPESEPIHKKLPIILYIHGGGFCMLSPFAAPFHRHCTQLAEDTSALVVSVDYGLFPTRPIPACYDDSWAALKWVAAHSSGSGPDPWLTAYGDFNNVFIAGDSAGGNIAHTLAMRVGSLGTVDGAKLVGVVMMHPFFGGTEDDLIWMKMCPNNQGLNDPRMNPNEEDLIGLGCEKVLIFVAENDHLCQPGKSYYEKLRKSGWRGKVEIYENLGREHCFHIVHPVAGDEEAEAIRRLVAAFVKNEGHEIEM